MTYSLDSKLGDLLVDPRVVLILEKYLPGASKNPMIGMAKGMALKVILTFPQARQAGLTKELAEKVIRLTGSKSGIVKRPLPPDDPSQRQPDISLAKSELGWSPGIKLEDGLERTIKYFKSVI